jgi:hypothetical protein
MKRLRELIESLLRTPVGFNADGHRLGVGLAAAMARHEQGFHREVEAYLHSKADARNMSS